MDNYIPPFDITNIISKATEPNNIIPNPNTPLFIYYSPPKTLHVLLLHLLKCETVFVIPLRNKLLV